MSTLLSTTDCGPSNALAQLSKHTDRDRSLQYDRVVGQSSSRLQRLPPSASQSPLSQAEVDIAAQFFTGPSVGPSRNSERVPHPVSQSIHSAAWTSEFHAKASSFAISRDVRVREDMEAALTRAQSIPVSHMATQPSLSWQAGFSATQPTASVLHSSLSQGPRITEIPDSTWEREFARFATQIPFVDLKGKGRAVVDEVQLEEAFARASIDNTEAVEMAPNKRADYMAEFENVWTQIRADGAAHASSQGDLREWEAEFSAMRSLAAEDGDPGDEEFTAEFQRRFNEIAAGDSDVGGELFGDGVLRYDVDGMPDLGEYDFEPNNPYLSIITGTSLPSLLEQSLSSPEPSSLTRSALILEAMIQLGTSSASAVDIWYALGQVLCRDEREEKGIKALSRAVRESGRGEGGKAAMLELAIAYVNESHDLASFLTLLRFLRLSYPTHPGLPDAGQLRGQSSWAARDAVKEAFLSLAREQHMRGQVDGDIQIGLGVLLYSGGEFDRAGDCFKAALGLNPENAVLWNRLGSCLSNGNRPEEAIGAYQRALEIWPNYTRAVFNVGVACLNMGAHHEAVEHFLSAISMHDGSGSLAPLSAIPRGVQSNDQIWKTLRRAFIAMNRPDLAERALAPDRSATAFRLEGFDF